jgi:hypothetical protein
MNDPVTFLKSSLTKRGKTDPKGVYLTNLVVSAEAEADYGYEKNIAANPAQLVRLAMEEYEFWEKMLISIRKNPEREIHQNITGPFGSCIIQFIPEDHDLSCTVFMPRLELGTFDYSVCIFQEFLKEFAKFAGLTPTYVRFNIGVVLYPWAQMVEDGFAEERVIEY